MQIKFKRRIASMQDSVTQEGPIDIIFHSYKSNRKDKLATLKPQDLNHEGVPYSYSDVYNYLSIKHKDTRPSDECFQFVKQFKSGQVFLPQRHRLLQLATQALSRKPSKRRQASLEFHVVIIEPKERFSKSGRIYEADNFTIKANPIGVTMNVACQDFKTENMYTTMRNIEQSYLQKAQSVPTPPAPMKDRQSPQLNDQKT